MMFWDASAVVPLLVRQACTTAVLRLQRSDPDMIVWWGTEIECVSALARLVREGYLDDKIFREAEMRLNRLADDWHVILPADPLRSTARRLLRIHALRAADALQLSAALRACEALPRRFTFVCLDERLGQAAVREGFELRPR